MSVGLNEGMFVGAADRIDVGPNVGILVVDVDGGAVRIFGISLNGEDDGKFEGKTVGFLDGETDGCFDGDSEGLFDGNDVGNFVGDLVIGAGDGSTAKKQKYKNVA